MAKLIRQYHLPEVLHEVLAELWVRGVLFVLMIIVSMNFVTLVTAGEWAGINFFPALAIVAVASLASPLQLLLNVILLLIITTLVRTESTSSVIKALALTAFVWGWTTWRLAYFMQYMA